MGVIDKVIANGKPTQGLSFNEGGKEIASISLNDVGDGQTLYPYVFLYQQSKNERLLLDYLTTNCCPVYWDTSLISLQQKVDGAEVVLKNNEGEYALTCDWVIGADGAHSTVRKQSQIPFNGDTYPNYFYLADLKLDTTFLTGDYIQLYITKKNLAGFFPMPEKDCYRIIGNLPVEFGQREDVTAEEILPYLNELAHSTVRIAENYWFTTYKLHHRMADKFREGRCFLIGDAAHIHSPVGGQGMNTGLQDAYNLAWKLAGVIRQPAAGARNPAPLPGRLRDEHRDGPDLRPLRRQRSPAPRRLPARHRRRRPNRRRKARWKLSRRSFSSCAW